MESNQQKPRRSIHSHNRNLRSSKTLNGTPTIRDGLAKHSLPSSMFYKWKRQLAVGRQRELQEYKAAEIS